MSEPFLAEIRIVGFNFAPRGWAFCDGQILPINQNQSLYSLLGTIYGGDGRVNFALPELRGRAPIHYSSAHPQSMRSGSESHVLVNNEMPQHSHQMQATSDQAGQSNPEGNIPARKPRRAPDFYAATPLPADTTNLNSGSVELIGGGQAHDNMQPYLAVQYVIALQGLFPSRN